MDKFKRYITEGRDAPLYHATLFWNGFEILRTGWLRTTTVQTAANLLKDESQSAYRHGVSMTRNLRYAKDWRHGMLFVFDQRKLAQDYQIAPINYFAYNNKARGSNTEAEEFVLSDKKIPIDRYLLRFYINDLRLNSMDKVRYEYEDDDPDFVKRIAKIVFEHPRFAGSI